MSDRIKLPERETTKPHQYIESQKSHSIKIINNLIDNNETDIKDILTLIRKKFGYSANTVNHARKQLLEKYLEKLAVLQEKTKHEVVK